MPEFITHYLNSPSQHPHTRTRTQTHIIMLKPKGGKVRVSSELPQSDGNLERGIRANGTETDLLRLGEKLRFPKLIRALAGVAHK